jgi:choline monooxygenase
MDTYADPFETWIGDMPKALGDFDMKAYTYQTTLTFEVKCNWKVYVDNYCEGYHISTAHPGLEKMIDSKKYSVTPFSRPDARTGKFAIHAAPQRTGSPSGGLWLYAYPNWAFNVYSWGMDVEMILPLGHDKTLLELYYYTHSSQDADTAAKSVKDLIETSKIVVGEDIQLVEAVQRNLDAGIYQRGVLCKEKENGVFDFKNEYHLWMGH